jgi:uncharacterized protein YjbJ (UPF0337 family)
VEGVVIRERARRAHLQKLAGTSINRTELEGRKKSVKGPLRQDAGTLTGNRSLRAEGAREMTEGLAQERIGSARRKIGEAIQDLGRKFRR